MQVKVDPLAAIEAKSAHLLWQWSTENMVNKRMEDRTPSKQRNQQQSWKVKLRKSQVFFNHKEISSGRAVSLSPTKGTQEPQIQSGRRIGERVGTSKIWTNRRQNKLVQPFKGKYRIGTRKGFSDSY